MLAIGGLHIIRLYNYLPDYHFVGESHSYHKHNCLTNTMIILTGHATQTGPHYRNLQQRRVCSLMRGSDAAASNQIAV